MSRKDYKALAHELALLLGQLEKPEAYEPVDSFNEFLMSLCIVLKSDNPNFNRDKFIEAVTKG